MPTLFPAYTKTCFCAYGVSCNFVHTKIVYAAPVHYSSVNEYTRLTLHTK